MADQSGSAYFHELFESALQAYEDKVVVTLAEHPLAIQLQSCNTVESITAVLQGQLKAFSEFRRGETGMEPIKNTISILTKVSDAATFAVGIGLVGRQVRLMCSTTLTVFTAIPTCKSNIRWSRYPTCCMCVF
jgi:hypothetical protein